MRINTSLVCVIFLLGVLEACSSSSDGNSASCAPPGKYVPTAVRSADPGTCPAAAQLPVDWAALDVTPEMHPCGSDSADVSGTSSLGSDMVYCTYVGTIVLTGSSSGIQGTAHLTLTECASQATCTANYDLTYTLQTGDAGT